MGGKKLSPKEGYVYVAAGRAGYAEEAIASVASLRKVSPKAHATMITDAALLELCPELEDNFDRVIVDEVDAGLPERTAKPVYPSPWQHYTLFGRAAPKTEKETEKETVPLNYALAASSTFRVRALMELSPYERTFNVDTDTYFVENTDALFELLDYFEFVMPQATSYPWPILDRAGKPLVGYDSYTTATFVYRKDEKTAEFFREWYRLQLEAMAGKNSSGGSDQVTFMMALLDSPCRVYVTQPNWSARLPLIERFTGPVRLIHARSSLLDDLPLEEAANRVNASEGHRVWLPYINRCLNLDMDADAFADFVERAQEELAKRGNIGVEAAHE